LKWTPDDNKCEDIQDILNGVEKQNGKIFLSIHSGSFKLLKIAFDLISADIGGKSDPFCHVWLSNDVR
jgi:hypothetical protein